MNNQKPTNSTERPAPRSSSSPSSNNKAYVSKRKQRRAKQNKQRAIVLLVSVAFIMGLAWVITGIISEFSNPFGDSDVSDSQVQSSSAVSSTPELPTADPSLPEAEIPSVDNTGWNTIGPLAQDPAAMTVLSPDSHMIALPENGRVDMSYFNTSVFVGDSITQGLFIYPSYGIPNANFCAYLGVSPRQIYDGSMQKRNDGVTEVPMEALVGYQPDNVYVLLGTNAMVSMGDEALLGYYSEMLDTMRASLHPEVSIYVQSITPVVQGQDARFDIERINNLNDQLAKMAYEKGMYFLDLHEALAGDDGWMRPEYGGGDGYHMTPEGYAAWVEYLVTHTAYNKRHAHLYLEGSHYYSQLPSAAAVAEAEAAAAAEAAVPVESAATA